MAREAFRDQVQEVVGGFNALSRCRNAPLLKLEEVNYVDGTLAPL